MMAEILPSPGTGMLSPHLSAKEIPVEREICEHGETTGRQTRLEAVLMEIGHTHFGVYLVPRDNGFHAAAEGRSVVPIEALAVTKYRGLDVRHQRGPLKSLSHDALRDITQTEDVAALDRR